MLRRTLLWILPFTLCAAVAATELLQADSALMRGDYGAAVQILQVLANSGDSTAQVRLARLFHRGEGVKRDIDEAVSLYLAAAELGHPEAQFTLGNMYLIGEGLPQDLDWAQTFYRLAAEQGHVLADQNLREINRVTELDTAQPETVGAPVIASDTAETEPAVAAAPVDAAELIEAAPPIEILEPIEDQIERLDSTVAASAPTTPALESDVALAVTRTNILEQVDDLTDGTAGRTPSSDEAEALRLAEEHGIDVQAAPPMQAKSNPDESEPAAKIATVEERFANAENALAAQNFTDGSNRLTQLSKDGYAPAALRLADMASRGEGRAANAAAAMIWRQRAAELGSSEAQYQLAESYMHGRGVERDEAMAITYYREAVRGGHPLAMEKLRSIYAEAGIPMPDFSRPGAPIAINSTAQVELESGATPSTVAVTVAAETDEFESGGLSGASSSSALGEPLEAAELEPEIHAAEAIEVLPTATQISTPESAVEAPAPEVAPMRHGELSEGSQAGSISMVAVTAAAPAIIVTHPPAHLALPGDQLATIEPAKPANHEIVPGSLLATDSRPELQPTLSIKEPIVEVSPEPLTELDVADLVDSAPIASFESADVEWSSFVSVESQAPEIAATSARQGDITVNETFNEPSDEARALRLAQEHGIEVRLDETTEASSVTSTAVEISASKGAVAADNEALQSRFEGAKRALALENFTHGGNRLKQLVDEGYAPAALRLAQMAERGEGIPANAAAAMTWRQRAADMGSAEAQYQLAESYMRGRGVETDEAMAITYYRAAARSGHPLAKEKLRLIYADAGIPMPDFSRPRKPIAIYPPAAVSNQSVTSTKVSAFAEVDVRQPITELSTLETHLENPTQAAVPHAELIEPTIDVPGDPIDEIDVAEVVDATPIAALDKEEVGHASADTIASDPVHTAAASVKPATQISTGLFSRFKRLFSRDEETIALKEQPLGSEPTAETMADTPAVIADEVGYVATTAPEIGIDPTDIEIEAGANVFEPDPLVDHETNVEVAPSLATTEDGKRALADGRFNRSAEIFTRLAQDGDAEAQAHIGYMYYRGEGVELDHGRAIEWYRRAADQGNRDAQYNLAAAYAFGEGVAQDDSKAVMWYRRAAEQGSAIAQYSLGVSYALGEGITRDYAQATRWYRLAAEQGYAAAQYNLGFSYRSGHGIDVDEFEAFQWFTKAAHNGHAAAQYSLGYMYRSGRGVTRDLDEAIKWYRLAADQGHPDARADLASLNTDRL